MIATNDFVCRYFNQMAINYAFNLLLDCQFMRQDWIDLLLSGLSFKAESIIF